MGPLLSMFMVLARMMDMAKMDMVDMMDMARMDMVDMMPMDTDILISI